MEYSTNGTTWITCPDVEVTDLAAETYFVRFKTTNTAFHSEAVSVEISTNTGIETITNEELQIYPNPVKDKLYIDIPFFEKMEYLKNVEILDLTGKIIYNL